MQSGKEINNVSATTAIDLKAQLAQHVEQFEKVRSSTGKQAKAVGTNNKKATVWSRQNKGVQLRNERDEKQQLEQVEGSTLSRSREQLERKARIYEAMQSGKYQEDYENEDQSPLIDFDRKYLQEKELEESRRQKDKKRKRKEEKDDDDDNDPWVEYEDEFGRTRIVRRSELPSQDEFSDRSSDNDEEDFPEMNRPGHDGFGSRYDMNHFEADREIRTKGVGFYGFSKDEHERQQQMAKLKALRDETLEARQSSTISASEKRKQMLAKNAEKIRARKAALLAKKHHQLKPEQVPAIGSSINVNEDSVSEFLQSIRKRIE